MSELTEKVEPSVGPGHGTGSPTPCGCGDDPKCNMGCFHPVSVSAVALTVSIGCSLFMGHFCQRGIHHEMHPWRFFFLFILFCFLLVCLLSLQQQPDVRVRDGTTTLHIHQVPLTSKCPGCGVAGGTCPITVLYMVHILQVFFSRLLPPGGTIQFSPMRIGIIWYSIFSLVEPDMKFPA